MSEDNPNIVVREIRGEKKVGFRGLEYVERDESELRQLVENKKETIIALHEADSLSSPKRQWEFGRIVEETAENGDNSELKEILKYSTLNIAQSYDLKLFQNFYQMFPKGDFDEQLPWALYREMLVDKRLDEFHDVYTRIIEDIPDSERIRTYEYRAYLNAEGYDNINVVKSLYNLGERQTSGLTPEKTAESARHVKTIAGEDSSSISLGKVEQIIQHWDLKEE